MILASTRLGIMACRYLVKGYYENRYMCAPEIANRYNMNVRTLMPALRQLTRSGILRSRVGGKEPGFIFAKDPSEFTLSQVMNSLEGEAYFECCKELMPELRCECENKELCELNMLFKEMIDNANKRMSTITMRDYAEKATAQPS